MRLFQLISILSVFQVVKKCSLSTRAFCVMAPDPTPDEFFFLNSTEMVPKATNYGDIFLVKEMNVLLMPHCLI